MKADDYLAAIENELDALASDPDVTGDEYIGALEDLQYSIKTTLEAERG
jgi:hypothetical protein